MNKIHKNLLARYLSIILVALLGYYIYYLLLPITLYPIYWILNWIYGASLMGNVLAFNGKEIEIIRACVGASAVSLLIILNLATPSIKWSKRAGIALTSILMFLVFNWVRISLLAYLYLNGSIMFSQLHLISWYFASTLAVAMIWIICIKLFSIKEIPFWSDLIETIKNFGN